MAVICVDCRYVGGSPSGIGEMVRGLIDHAPALMPDVGFMLLRHPDAVAPLNPASNVREVVVPYSPNGPASMWLLPRLVDLSAVDLFHAPSNILPAGLTMPCVTTIHDMMWLTNPEWCKQHAFKWLDRAFYAHGMRRAIRRSAAIATVSGATRDAVVAWEPNLVDR